MGTVTIAIARAASYDEPPWAEHRIELTPSTAILLRSLIEVRPALLYYRSRFHKILGVGVRGHITIDREPYRTPDGLPVLLLTGSGHGEEPRDVSLDIVDFRRRAQ